MFDFITFGSATNDIFFNLPNHINQSFENEETIKLPLGEKIETEQAKIFSGGGGTNTACAFANFGLKTAYCGKVGDDGGGMAVRRDLTKFGVSQKLCLTDKSLATAVSVVLFSGKERTILVGKGACHSLKQEEINFKKISKTKWFYIAPLYGSSANLFPLLLQFALKNKIKTAINPSSEQIKKGKEFIKSFVQADVLFLNREEACLLLKEEKTDDYEIINLLGAIFPETIIVITNGERGAMVKFGNDIIKESASPAVVKDKTGAGDSFAAGFMAGLFLQDKIKYAIKLGLENSASCISAIGPKNGFLSSKDFNEKICLK